ncbi:MAG TPA: hypothetical protein VKO84_05100 [Gaiellaceae bacterium]|nr:hypothetical protein [Gaiellaceae bacterium]
MRVVPSSPRLRRRFLRLGIALLVVGAVTTTGVLVRSPKGPSSAPPKNAPPAQLVKQSTYVSAAERRAINKTLDAFIPAGLDGTAPETAWRLSGPELKGGSTLREWRHGTSPIPYYPARGKTFHDWTVIDSGPGYVDFNILIHPRRGEGGSSEVFSGKMLKREGRWVVDGLYTIAVFARPNKKGRHEVGPADYAAGPAASSGSSGAPPSSGKSTLGKGWLGVIGGGILLALLFPIGLGVASAIRSRRSRLAYARSRGQALPPLPRTPPSAGGAGIGGPRH